MRWLRVGVLLLGLWVVPAMGPARAAEDARLRMLEGAVARALVQLDLLAVGEGRAQPGPVLVGEMVPAVDEADVALAALRILAVRLERLVEKPEAEEGSAEPDAWVWAALAEDRQRLVALLDDAASLPRARLIAALRAVLADLDGALAALATLE